MGMVGAMPLISVILPIYNVGKFLPACMERVCAQTYMNLEIIMVDDGSTDGTGLICDEYAKKDRRVRVYHKENGGLSDARNYGIGRAVGEYITCIDPDDVVTTDYVEYLLDLIKKYETKMSLCDHRVIFSNGKIKDKSHSGDEAMPVHTCLERMLYHDVIDTSAWAKLYHRSLFETVQYPVGKNFEDIGTTYALMMQCETIAVGYEAKYDYAFRYNSIVHSSFSEKKLDLVEMTDKMARDVEKVYPDLGKAVLRRQVYARISTLNQTDRADETPRIKEIRKELLDYIGEHKAEVKKNPKTPFRDKVALTFLPKSYGLYRTLWRIVSG